jgi:hypothetical protein
MSMGSHDGMILTGKTEELVSFNAMQFELLIKTSLNKLQIQLKYNLNEIH